ncbi:MAG: hypothetical protein SVW77_01880 [Candidatus Nanohaloarchaea archaeon]|nr:hypothetical protein [Candidatus Nanohaloarchaea archaeon]
MTDDVLTFEELRQVQSRERDSDTLQDLDESFFDRAQNYLELKRGGENHLENQEYRNARNILEDILDMRQKKIVKLAFLSVKSGVTVDNMLPHEEDLFEDVKELIADYRGERHDDVFDGPVDTAAPDDDASASTGDVDDVVDTGADDPEPESAEDIVDDTAEPVEDDSDDAEGDVSEEPVEDADEADDEAEEEEQDADGGGAADDILQFGDEDGDHEEDAGEEADDGGETGADVVEASEPEQDEDDAAPAEEPDTEASDDAEEDDGRVTVQVQERVPEFMGTDLEPYGPFEEGDEVEVPAENADVLVQQGKAERA